ncbi:MAG: GAF domain-containing protein [Actinomycetota bacterium]|nr:GAF domain-containing protein [Actinomycetota bacterium]
MTSHERDLLAQLAGTATDIGPALVPEGHLELLQSITSAAQSLFGAAACSLALLDDDEEQLDFYVASGAGAEDVVGMRMPVGRGIAGWVVSSGQPIAIEDVAKDKRFAVDVAQSTGYTPRSILAMPLETERRMLGVISVLDRSSDRPETARDIELLSLFAEQAALAIENSRVFSNLGAALLRAMASAAGDGDLGRALEETARDADAPSSDLAELAAHFHELGMLGAGERRAATRLVGEFLSYVRRRR